MTYTTQQLQAMSDFEIAILICQKTGKQVRKEQFLGYDDRDPNVVLLHGAESFNINNPNDIMPLAFERGISLISLSDGYMATKIKDIYMAEQYRSLRFCDPSCEEYADTNPLRAIACLLLMMDE